MRLSRWHSGVGSLVRNDARRPTRRLGRPLGAEAHQTGDRRARPSRAVDPVRHRVPVCEGLLVGTRVPSVPRPRPLASAQPRTLRTRTRPVIPTTAPVVGVVLADRRHLDHRANLGSKRDVIVRRGGTACGAGPLDRRRSAHRAEACAKAKAIAGACDPPPPECSQARRRTPCCCTTPEAAASASLPL